MNKKKLCIIIPNMGGGGAEKMVLHLLQKLNRSKYQIQLVLFEKKGIYYNEIPADITTVCLQRKGKFSYFKMIYKLAFRVFPLLNPDIVISFMLVANILTLITTWLIKPAYKLIISVRNNPEIVLHSERHKWIKGKLLKYFYPLATHIIVISEGIRKSLIRIFGLNAQKISVVYNGINIEQVKKLSAGKINISLHSHESSYTITACGRLEYQKGFNFLIDAFSKVADKLDAILLILGEGTKRKQLIGQINERGMAKRIFLPGFIPNPYPVIARSDLFVLSSMHEGFGNVLLEAMVCRTPIIATDCPYGPAEIITHDSTGFLVPPSDIYGLSNAIESLLINKTKRLKYIKNGKNRVKQFSLAQMLVGYETVFKRVLKL
ncbi:MAG: glycosyltransferase [Spirochaetales bacterium]|nr:glycosyltransferase [Spirochaetales bacterium]